MGHRCLPEPPALPWGAPLGGAPCLGEREDTPKPHLCTQEPRKAPVMPSTSLVPWHHGWQDAGGSDELQHDPTAAMVRCRHRAGGMGQAVCQKPPAAPFPWDGLGTSHRRGVSTV